MADLEVFRRFGRLRRAVGMALARRLKPYGLGPKQSSIILSLSEHGPVSPARLSEFTLSDPAAISRSLDVLVAHGLAERKDSSTDRRAWQVRLTKKGRDLAGKISGLMKDLEKSVLRAFTREETNTFISLLERFINNADKTK